MREVWDAEYFTRFVLGIGKKQELPEGGWPQIFKDWREELDEEMKIPTLEEVLR
jgi:hypothetical protein